MEQVLNTLIVRQLVGGFTLWVQSFYVCAVKQKLLDYFDRAGKARHVQGRSVQWGSHFNVCSFAQKQELNNGWVHPTHSDVKRRHLRVVGQQVWVGVFLKKKKLDDAATLVFN